MKVNKYTARIRKQTQLLKYERLGMKKVNNEYTALISFTFDIEATCVEDAEYIAIQAIPKPFVFRSDRHGRGTFLRGITPVVYTRGGIEAELLAQPEQTEQEPVAWMYDHQIEVGYDKYTEVNIIETCARNLESNNCINIRPLYLAPPKREPLSEDNLDVLAVLAEANITDEGIAGYYLGFRDAEKMNGIGGGE